MADKKITELVQIDTISSGDVFPIVDISDNITKKIDITQIKAQSPVQSVNSNIGAVVLTKTDIGLSNVDNTSDANKPVSTATQTALDGKVDENAAITGATKTKITYDAKGLVTAGADATTADIADSTNKRYVTDAQSTVIGNTSGTNTGDNAVNSLYSGLAASKQDALTLTTTGTSGAATLVGATLNIPQYSGGGGTTWGSITGTLSTQTDLQTALDLKVPYTGATGDVDLGNFSLNAKSIHAKGTAGNGHLGLKHQSSGATAAGSESVIYADSVGDPKWKNASNTVQSVMLQNTAITGATKTKITYDAKGLVTAGADATTADIAASTNKNYVTDAQQTVITNTSGTNSGDNAVNSLYSGLAASKQDTITGAATTITSSDLTVSRALVSNASGKVAVATTTSTEIGYVNGVTSAIQTQIDTKSAKLITTNRQTASYTLVIGDADKLVEMNVGSANNLTIPLNSSVAFATGTQILLAQYGAGQTTVVATSGVTIRSSGGKLKLNAQYSGATLIKIATDEWYLFGDIAA
jgi:hypothetical protein